MAICVALMFPPERLMASTASCGSMLSCWKLRIESMPPMKKKRSGYVVEPFASWMIPPMRSVAANVTFLKYGSGKYPENVPDSLRKWPGGGEVSSA